MTQLSHQSRHEVIALGKHLNSVIVRWELWDPLQTSREINKTTINKHKQNNFYSYIQNTTSPQKKNSKWSNKDASSKCYTYLPSPLTWK